MSRTILRVAVIAGIFASIAGASIGIFTSNIWITGAFGAGLVLELWVYTMANQWTEDPFTATEEQ